MKKTYQYPTIKDLKIESEEMIAMSTSGSSNETSGNLSRRHDILWEDEE